ncbi:unnamed protein product [marine sediment metagenome]|uniref:Uncharacterized protein n=1 Tax=marine sediment metagenome TaxID=412755 RepID=X1BBK6_9ZZZZ
MLLAKSVASDLNDILISKTVDGIVHSVFDQAIGTGGRDLKAEVGGIMMIEGIKALQHDPLTEVIVSISKPPDKEVARKVVRPGRS